MLLTATPDGGLIDEPVTWQVEGVSAGSSVSLRLDGVDAAGRGWSSQNDYVVDEHGQLMIQDTDEPWTSMAPTDADTAPVTFTDPDDAWTCTAEATYDGRSAQTTVQRLYQSGVDRDERTGPRWRLRIYRPAEASINSTTVLLVPGSTGTAALAPTAALLASRGHISGVLGYMQEDGLPSSMRAIPVEIVTEAVKAFAGLATVDPDRIVVWAVSVGTGLALSALAGPSPARVAGVIAVSPTDVVWQALAENGRPPKASSLTRGGADLAYLPMHSERLLGQMLRHAVLRRLPGRARSTALRLYPAYDRSKDAAAAVAAATIPVERITAPMLFVAGTADAMWPSATMAETMARRRREHDVDGGDQLLLLPDAGHFLRPPGTPSTVDRNRDLVSGGTPLGIARGKRTAWQAAMNFLADGVA